MCVCISGDAGFSQARSICTARSPSSSPRSCSILQVWRKQCFSVSGSCFQKIQSWKWHKVGDLRAVCFSCLRCVCLYLGSYSPCTGSIWIWQTCLVSSRETPGLSLRANDHSAPLVLLCLLLSVCWRYNKHSNIYIYIYTYCTLRWYRFCCTMNMPIPYMCDMLNNHTVTERR